MTTKVQIDYATINAFIADSTTFSKEQIRQFMSDSSPCNNLPFCIALHKEVLKKLEEVLGMWYFHTVAFCRSTPMNFNKYMPKVLGQYVKSISYVDGNILATMENGREKILTKEMCVDGVASQVLSESAQNLKRIQAENAEKFGESIKLYRIMVDVERQIRNEAMYLLEALVRCNGVENKPRRKYEYKFATNFQRPKNNNRDVFKVSTTEGGVMEMAYFVRGGVPETHDINVMATKTMLYSCRIIMDEVSKLRAAAEASEASEAAEDAGENSQPETTEAQA